MSVGVTTNLSSWQQDLNRFQAGAADRIQKMLSMAAETVADDAQRLVPRGPSGDARASLRVLRGRNPVAVSGGGHRAPYYPWLEFGGRVGINNSVRRSVVPGGRYIWPAWLRDRKEILADMEDGLADEAKQAGF